MTGMTHPDPSIAVAAALLAEADSLLVLTGAGISVESGIPTYRGPEGVYEVNPTLPHLLSVAGLRDRPEEVWDYIDRMRVLVDGSGPNDAHRILARWEREGRFGRFLIATQNVDGLHAAAGSDRVSEIHGSIWRFAAPREEEPDLSAFFADADREEILRLWSRENEMAVWENREIPFKAIPPSESSGVRPDVLFFDEGYGNRLLWLEYFLKEGCDAILVVGCSGEVQILPYLIRCARADNPEVCVLNVNPHEDCIDGAHMHLPLGATDALTALDAELTSRGR